MQFRLIVPPAFEAALGLMIGAAERDYNRRTWRVELWPGEAPRLFKQGERWPVEHAPPGIVDLIRFAREAFSA